MIVLLTTLAFASASVVKYEPMHQPWKEMMLTAQVAHTSGRFKRHIELNEKGKIKCILPNGNPGICKPTGQCGSNEDNKISFNDFWDYLCMLEETKPGTCCSDLIEVQKNINLNGSTVDRPASPATVVHVSCNLKDGTPGICKPKGQCGSDTKKRFDIYYNTLCMFDEATPGTCCPDSIEAQTRPYFSGSTGTTVGWPTTVSNVNVSCNLQDGTPGICKPKGQCGSDEDNKTNFSNDSLCMLDDTTPGTCCPDRIETQTRPYSSGSTGTTVGWPTTVSNVNVSCNLQDGTPGICKPIGNKISFDDFKDYFCKLDETTPGTCCPDSIEAQTRPYCNGSTGTTVGWPATVSNLNVSCNLQDGTPGICKPKGQCGSDEDNKTNFSNDSLCMLDDTTPGTCCPNRIKIEERGKKIDSSTGDRPATACKEENNDSCDLPDGTLGICKPMLQCVSDEDIKKNLPQFLSSLCVIGNSKKIGACCPDSSKAFGVHSLPGHLPITASNEESKDTLLKINRADDRECGFSTRPRDQLASSELNSHTWPWMATISFVGVKHYFGGVLITDKHILTAAHCLNDFAPENLKVRLGEYDFMMKNESRTYTFNVVEIKQHENYDKMTRWNDIAILKLHLPAVFNTYVWPVCLPPPGLELVNETAILTGWGTIRFGAPMSNFLQEVEMPIWDHQQCVQNFVDTVFEENYCVGGYDGGKDACQYDSGGPLMYKMPSGRWVAIGIVSWGLRCGEPNHPGIYTRTDKYLDWIERHINV